jgi:hypothetical protein
MTRPEGVSEEEFRKHRFPEKTASPVDRGTIKPIRLLDVQAKGLGVFPEKRGNTSELYKIPLISWPQTFLITPIHIEYRFTLTYIGAAGWHLTIADSSPNPILNSIPLVTGVDLLGQYTYKGIGIQLWSRTDRNHDAVPTFENLGSASNLYFSPV